MFRNETGRLDSSLKFPELIDGRELDTLEYSNNKEELDMSKLEQERKKLFENYQSKEKTLDKYLIKTEERSETDKFHEKKESVFTLSNKDLPKSKGEQTTYNSTAINSRPGS